MKLILALYLSFLSFFCYTQVHKINDSLSFINSTYLGGELRNFYGNYAPDTLEVIWKTYLGKGKTTISRKAGDRLWAGSGWTGQPLMVQEGDSLYLLQPTFNHSLKKISAIHGNIIWSSPFNDVLKGAGTIHYDAKTKQSLVFQGSRLGHGNFLDSLPVESFKAIAYDSGKTLWTHNSKMTSSYSRDVDGSCLVIDDTLYIGLENGLFTKMSPTETYLSDTIKRPIIYDQDTCYFRSDIKKHGGNVVTEGSISRIGNKIYIPSGSGYLFEYDMNSDSIINKWFFGSDIDGSAVITKDSCILVSIEKQYINGKGGLVKINPRKTGKKAFEWYFPTENTSFAGWEGGVIGSSSVNYHSNIFPDKNLAVVAGIDSLLYLLDTDQLDTLKGWVDGPNKTYVYPTPTLLDSYRINRSISTPLLIGNKIIACGYQGVFLFQITPQIKLELLSHMRIGEIESTPFVWNGRIYIGSRNGYLYCLGRLNNKS